MSQRAEDGETVLGLQALSESPPTCPRGPYMYAPFHAIRYMCTARAWERCVAKFKKNRRLWQLFSKLQFVPQNSWHADEISITISFWKWGNFWQVIFGVRPI